VERFIAKPWLKAYSGLSINISAAFFISAFVGLTIAFPKNIIEFVGLTANVLSAILFLLITVLCEREIEK